MTRVLLRAFPPAWRDRYGSELEALTDDVRLTPGVAVDLVRSGMRQRAEGLQGMTGRTSTFGPASRHPTVFAALAALLLAPAAFFVGGSLLAYNAGVDGLRGIMDATGTWIEAAGVANLVLLAAAPASMIMATLPMLRLEPIVGQGGGLRVALDVRLANVAVAVAAAAVCAVLAWYGAAEAGRVLGA